MLRSMGRDYPGPCGRNGSRMGCRGAAGREDPPAMTSQHAPSGRPIADYALLSDCRGAALGARDGAVEWWCAPRCDSRAHLGRLLDPDAGHWTLGPVEPAETTRWYLPDTMVLRTEHRCAGGRLRV